MCRELNKWNACFVYIIGVRQVSDELWKWCAEYSQKSPWIFFIFEDTDTSWLLPENVDRIVKNVDDVAASQDTSVRMQQHMVDFDAAVSGSAADCETRHMLSQR